MFDVETNRTPKLLEDMELHLNMRNGSKMVLATPLFNLELAMPVIFHKIVRRMSFAENACPC